MSALHLRPYRAEDEAAAIDLWHRTWQQAYPQIDFAARLDWWRERWRKDLVPKASIVVAEADGALTGFVTIDGEGYLDQLVVDPRILGLGCRAAAGGGSQAPVTFWRHAARQQGQHARHPLLRAQRLCACRRRRESDLGTAGAEDGVEAVGARQSLRRRPGEGRDPYRVIYR
ncbi:hypothetical protein ABIF42_008517 [Bradyrhizobium diazoefficiens]